MIAKHQISHNVRNLIAYCLRIGKHQEKLEQTKPRILMANLCPPTKNLKALVATIQGANNMRHTDRVHHLIFAHPKSDVRQVAKIGEDRLIQEAIDGLKEKGINLDETPYVVIAHQDKENHIDYHLIAASTNLKGRAIKDGYIGSRAMHITNEISKKYGLSLNNDKTKRQRKKVEVKPIAQPEKVTSEKIELADVQAIEVDPSVTEIKGKGITENLSMAGDRIKSQRQRDNQKIADYNSQCDYIGLSKYERTEVWIGHDITIKAGRDIHGYTNDTDTTIRGVDTGDKITLMAIVEGVLKDVVDWVRELGQRIDRRRQRQQQDDKARKQSQQAETGRAKRRGLKM